MTYAVNLIDLSEVQREARVPMVSILLGDFVSASPKHIQIDPRRIDTGAILLDGPAADDEKRVQGLIDLLQTVIGPRKIGRRIRCYQTGPRGGWKEIVPRPKETE